MSADKQLTSAEIDALCDSFEQDCKSAGGAHDEFPSLEDYLNGLEGDDRQEVLRELLIIEHHYRIRDGIELDEDTYHRRFPGFEYIVDEVLSAGLGHSSDTELHSGHSRTVVRAESNGEDQTFDSLLEALPADDGDGISPVLGDYELIDELGRGGMGIVFRARQMSVDRLVALKVLRRDRLKELADEDREMMIERFRTESHSAAQLEHDHIVPVYEVGEADGIHFYSMRYVPGESLAELIAEHPLDNHSAAEAIEPIARALQAAHERGVLHRDIKPRNIMIDDATGRPLLTDFGLAKLLESKTDMTHTGDVMGSPPYMSPEQATDAAHVTAAADVYSIGATLYHALTGRPPFQAATMAETLRQVWFEEPPPPCSLNPAIDRDLETICLKCLEKEPARRFSDAGELSNELRRYLRGEPILSRPLGTLGQLQRWRRRNPAVANLTAAIILLVVIGFVGFIYYTVELRKSLADAQASLGDAVGAVNEMTDIATKEDGLKAYGVDDVRREMLNASREYYDRFVERETNDPVLETERGKAYGRLADIEADLGNQEEAIRLYQQSVDVFARLEKKFPRQPNYTALRASYVANLAGLYYDFGQLKEAEETLTEAYKLAKDLHAAHPASVEYASMLGQIHNERGIVYMDLAEDEKAEKARLETVNLWQQIVEVDDAPEYQHQLATSHNNLAEFYRNRGQTEKAAEPFDQAISIWRDLTEQDPLISQYSAGLALGEYNRGLMHLEAGEIEEAEPLLISAEGRRRRLAEKHSQLPQYQDALASSHDSIGRLQHARQDFAGAAADYRMALTIREELRNKFPSVPKYEIAYASSQTNLGYLYKDEGRFAEAADYFRIALDILQRVVGEKPDNVSYQEHLADVHYNLALTLILDNQFPSAEEHAQRAAAIHERLAKEGQSNELQTAVLADCYDLLALAQQSQGKIAAAAETYERSIQLLTSNGNETENASSLISVYLRLANMWFDRNNLDAAISATSAAIETVSRARENAGDSAEMEQFAVFAYSARAELYDEQGEHQKAVDDWDQVLKVQEHPTYQLRRAVSLARGGNHIAATEVVEELDILDQENARPSLLLNAACVYSRSVESVEANDTLDDTQRKETAERLLQQGTTFLERLFERDDLGRGPLAEHVRQDRDLT